jgi:hypothetical protein
MSDIVDILLPEEVYSQDPGAGHNDLIDPLAVAEDFGSLLLVHHNLSLLFNRLLVSADADNQVGVREELLGLLQYFSMAHMVHVEDAIRVNAHRVVRISSIGL